MDLGRILQTGPPHELYNHPLDVFVARFLGPTNLLQGQIDSNGSETRREVVVRTLLGRLVARAAGGGSSLAQGTPVTISIRPETLSLGPSIPPDWNRFPATIERIFFQGAHPPGRSLAVRRLADHGPGSPEPIPQSSRGPEPDALGLARVCDPAPGQVRGWKRWLRMGVRR